MTTSQSPLRVLKAQASTIAARLKAAERGEITDARIMAALSKPVFKVGVVMDDKVIKFDLPWETIRSMGEVALAEYILKHMRGLRETMH